MRSESRQGISVSAEELNRIDQIVSPLIKQGQSIHMICVNHADEIMLDEKQSTIILMQDCCLSVILIFHGKSVIENARRKKQLKLTKLVSVVVVMKIFRII
ncbi:MAG: hypothetical protein ACLSH0_09410 [Mediterraneibacter faecis]